MISVIIPTLWLIDELHTTLKELNDCELVGEIILIDNTPNKSVVKLSKVRHILEGKNTFVNPAWNKGVAMAKYEKLLILNDDTWFDWNLIYEIEKHINNSAGMIGISAENYKLKEPKSNISIEKIDHRPLAFACAFFIHKDNWIPIPETMKIWGGDEWLFRRLKEKSLQNYKLNNLKVDGRISATVNSLRKEEKMRKIMSNDSILGRRK